MIMIDEELQKAVAEKALCVKRPSVAKEFKCLPSLAAKLQMQPDLNALRAIDKVFRERGVVLTAYALAEINRWFVGDSDVPAVQQKHKARFIEALGSFKVAMRPFLGTEFNGFSNRSPAFMEAIGVLVADPELRDNFLKNTMTLGEHGFPISSQEEDALRRGFEPGGAVTRSAKTIHEIGWEPPSYCTSRLLVYDQFFHFNQ